MLWVGWPILRKFWFSLVHRALNMYSLIGLGVVHRRFVLPAKPELDDGGDEVETQPAP